jgi:hypothetical protein
MSNAPTLLPCPFCGGEAWSVRSVNGTAEFRVGCSPCGIAIKAAWYRGEPAPTKDIVAVWNRRAGEESLRSALSEERGKAEARAKELEAAINRALEYAHQARQHVGLHTGRGNAIKYIGRTLDVLEGTLMVRESASLTGEPPALESPGERKSQVRFNAERDPSYCPYCMRCTGLVRMRKVEDFYWRCGCGAEHDERRAVEQPIPTEGEQTQEEK